ncbi:MAG: MFS transporter [Rhodospirillaceae bacterium]|nr:MFS transporter [Rhodospirillaceae bacterium]|tara:strand:- start:7315 stop:8550 length:1236 start_codon:yes stop_codon:yes gene_type:complete
MPLGSYVRFTRANSSLVGFGFLMAFASSFGQTFFIGVFGPSIQREFGLSHTEWGTVYLIGTLASALLLPWSGKQIDRLDLRLYTLIVGCFLAFACFFAAGTLGPVMLVLTIFFLRQSGQGLTSHIAFTTMARYFELGRGRAIAIATLGFSTGEAVLPFAAVLLISVIGWRWSYAAAGAVMLLILLPTAIRLLKGHGERHRSHVAQQASMADQDDAVTSWTRAQVMRDRRFWLLMPGLFAPALILTALFFHHLNVAAEKGWSAEWITGNYVVYAGATIATSLAAGALVDRFGATRLIAPMLVPLVVALLAIGWGEAPIWVVIYFFFAGLSTGLAHTAVTAMWAELYGTAHLGAIKSLVASLGVFASALGPVIMGSLMDSGLSTGAVCYIFAASTAAGIGSVMLALRTPRPLR